MDAKTKTTVTLFFFVSTFGHGLDDPALFVSTLVYYILVLFLVTQLLCSLLKVCEDGVSSSSREGNIRNQSSTPWVRSPGRQCLVSTLHCLCLYLSPHFPACGVAVRASHLVALGLDPSLLLGLWTGMGSIDEIIVQGDGSRYSFVANTVGSGKGRSAEKLVDYVSYENEAKKFYESLLPDRICEACASELARVWLRRPVAGGLRHASHRGEELVPHLTMYSSFHLIAPASPLLGQSVEAMNST